ncbi:MAG: hypothetical protein ACI8UO_000744 [Verrucomicrobiales bacterium]|jgi:hypothetical protein
MKLATLLILAGLASAGAEPAIRPGDRIAIVGNTFADQLRIHGYLETLLLHHTEGKPVSIRNLGWGGDMLSARDRPTNFATEESTLTAHETDVIIACFGMGESFAGEAGLANFNADLEAFIESHRGKIYNGKTAVRLILVSPIASEDHGDRTPKNAERNRNLEAYSKEMGKVSRAAKIPFIDLFEPTRYHMSEPATQKFTTNGIHLNSYGYWAVSRILYGQLTEAKSQPWRLSLDAENALEFEITDPAGPTLSPPVDGSLPPQLANFRDTLLVENLDPGAWRLEIDGQAVASATHEEWSEGVVIDSSPIHQEAEEFRQAVNDKNLQFTYSWKALNQVHIVGERKKSNSGQALPAEVIEFNRLAEERDEALRKGSELKTRTWQLVPQKP